MTDEERAAYLAAAERLDAIADRLQRSLQPGRLACVVEPEALLSIGLMLPEGHPARDVLLWLQRNQRHNDSVFTAWLLEAAALKLRAQVEEACLG